MVIVAEAALVLSVTDVALMVTVLGVGAVVGAVKVVATPLPVLALLKLPQFDAEQVTLQCTPPLAESFETMAVTEVLWPTFNELGGAGLKATAIAGGGGGGLLPPPPQATNDAISAATAK